MDLVELGCLRARPVAAVGPARRLGGFGAVLLVELFAAGEEPGDGVELFVAHAARLLRADFAALAFRPDAASFW